MFGFAPQPTRTITEGTQQEGLTNKTYLMDGSLDIKELEKEYIELIKKKEEIEEEIEIVKNRLMMEFEMTGQCQFVGEEKVFNVIPESTTTKFDTKAFKQYDPETYNTFTRTSTVKAHVAVKENKKAKALKAFYADEAETFMLND